MIAVSKVDEVLDACTGASEDDDADVAQALGDMLDDHGAWGWSDGSDHDPSDRVALIESTGAWWVVYRGVEPDRCWRFDMRAAACAQLRAISDSRD